MVLAPKLLAILMIVSTMLGAGLQVDVRRIADTLRQYGLLARALLANFVLVPLVAVVLVRIFRVDVGAATGIVLMSMAPGVPFLVNSAGRKEGGSLSFALTIAFCFAALSVVTVPVTMWLVLPHTADAQLPVGSFLTTLVLFQLVPLIVGAVVAPRLSQVSADKAVQILHLVFFAAALVLVALVFPRLAGYVASIYGFGRLLIIMAIGLFSLAVGWLLGGPAQDYRRTLSIGTLMRNIGLCALIGTSATFANTLVVPAIFAYFVVTFILSLPLRAYYIRSKPTLTPAHSGKTGP
ncbi:MAG TPA: hypothetical protein VGN11_02495 [Candidatus Baltobacteraceae bacterium]|jgi:BASS family bile acid:Na+ symporter|nr:hypothetical protein [Candidatus Baltobacteraceae bacterium]